ncbi:MAG: TolC family protein [Anaeromyxobacter sp.]
MTLPPCPPRTLPSLRPARLAAALAILLAAPLAGATEPLPPTPPDDPVLRGLIDDTLSARPELKQAEASVAAERARVPQVGALPDPVLSLGIQNDGFEKIQIGEMETSYYQIMLSQSFPWPGKRGMRRDVARLSAEAAGATVSRQRLTAEAEVRRAYLALQLVRDRLGLLDQLEALWQKSIGTARARYEAGEGAQSDVLRAQLELVRLRQRRVALQADETARLQALNRLRDHPLDEPIALGARLRDQPLPALPDGQAALDDALARSPELAAARLSARQADASTTLARRERFPDLGLTVGLMPRGQLEPMWLASVSIGLPVWSGSKQGKAVEERQARGVASAQGQEAVAQTLRLRVAERRNALAAALETLRLYRDGLLVQSRATTESTLAQYRVGKLTFASVLEANAGYIADEDGFLQAAAGAQQLAIAAGEVSLDAPGGAGAGGGMGGTPVPGAGASGGGMSGGGAPAAAAPAEASGGSSSMNSGM